MSQLNDFLRKSSAYAVQQRLADVPVAIVAEKGIDSTAVNNVLASVRAAGGDVPGVLWLDDKWRLDTPKDLRALQTAAHVVTGNVAATRGRGAARARDAAVARPRATARRGGATSSSRCVPAGFLDFTDGKRSTLAAFPAHSARVLVLTGTDSHLVGDRHHGRSRAGRSSTADAPTVLGEVYDAQGAGRPAPKRGAALEPVRGDPPLAKEVTTLDDAELPAGRADRGDRARADRRRDRRPLRLRRGRERDDPADLPVSVVLGLVVGVLTVRLFVGAADELLHAPTLQRANHRGRLVPTAMGCWRSSPWCSSRAAVRCSARSGSATRPRRAAAAAPASRASGSGCSACSTTLVGTQADKGFRGHLGALAHGRVTTGLVKIVGGVRSPWCSSTRPTPALRATAPAGASSRTRCSSRSPRTSPTSSTARRDAPSRSRLLAWIPIALVHARDERRRRDRADRRRVRRTARRRSARATDARRHGRERDRRGARSRGRARVLPRRPARSCSWCSSRAPLASELVSFSRRDRAGARAPKARRSRPRSVTKRRDLRSRRIRSSRSPKLSQAGATVAVAVSASSEGACALAKHVFVTGGVASSLGKGLTASSLGRLLKSRGLRVTMQKLDPYINVDPGTMNPFQHGEVFVTDDSGETDLDLGHYERFVDVPLTAALERDDRLDLPVGARQGAHGRVPRRDGAGDPAHHQRDQGAHPRARRPTTSTS